MRARTLIALTAVAGALLPAAPADAACQPICSATGILSGSNLHLPFERGAFTWQLAFDGGIAEQGRTPRQVVSSARLFGMVEAIDGSRVSGVGTVAVFDANDGGTLMAVPVRFEGTAGGATSVGRAVFEPYGAGVGPGSTLTLLDGQLRGTFHGIRVTDDRVAGVHVTLSAPPTYVVGRAFPINGAVRRSDGTPLPAVPVDVEVDGAYLKRVQTGTDGTWATEIRFDTAQPRDLRAVAFASSPLPAASPTVRVSPTYVLTLVASGPGSLTGGGATCATTCTVPIAAGSSVAVTQRAQRFYRFSSWSGHCSGSGGCSVVMSGPRSVTGGFVKLNWDVLESEPNDTSASADLTVLPGIYAGNLTSGDVDIAQISVPVATTLYVETFDRFLACDEPIDTTITVRSSSGAPLAFDDDGGPGLCSSLAVPVLPGIVRIEVRPYGSTTADEYRLKLRVSDPTEPNDTIATATAVSTPTDTIGAISPIGDRDHYRFSVDVHSSSTSIEVFDPSGTSCEGGIDPVLLVYDGDGATYDGWSADDEGPGLCPSISLPLAPGTYTVRIADYGDNSVIPAYRLRISSASFYPSPT